MNQTVSSPPGGRAGASARAISRGSKSVQEVAPRVAILGAGVIGRVLAARLHEGGVDVTLVARGNSLERLRAEGVRLRMRGRQEHALVRMADAADPGQHDVVLLCARASDLDSILPVVEAMGRPTVVPTMHLGNRWPDLVERFGEERIVRAFPGLGGYIDESGTVEWLNLGGKQPKHSRRGSGALQPGLDRFPSFRAGAGPHPGHGWLDEGPRCPGGRARRRHPDC
ncbi:hypothetical protein LKO27_11285 [Tessaracoccus sp. OS52]|uniref:ketopantoate reductase family protein n=1 Tax=Tessaracoccus sp. OS52 TaxID=2886691 RepID=UPI001D106F54|nr:2-dehydropantoate 2-reductase N-terminal domain-containing protein [Tessaracoccus sp. OS52]MCC2593989.1 hypothetical protein [Tessaracoccus sp. OS52]